MNWLQNLELGIQWKVKATRFNCLIFEQKPVLLKVSEKEDEELTVLEEFVRRGNLQVPHTHSCKWNTKLFDFNVWSALTIPWRKSYLICYHYTLFELHGVQVPENREQLKGEVGLFGMGGEPEVLERQDRQSSWEGLGPEVGLKEEFVTKDWF